MDTGLPPYATIRLDLLAVDSGLQPRLDGIDLEHLRALEPGAEAWPPIKVVRLAAGYIVVDGFGRFAAAQNLELTEINLEVLDAPSHGDLHSLAYALNAAHGRPLTLTDRRAFAGRLLRAHPDWSDREIGRRACLVQPTIAKVRQQLERGIQIEPPPIRTGRDGRSYPSSPRRLFEGEDRPTLFEAISRIFTPAERRAKQALTRNSSGLLTHSRNRTNLRHSRRSTVPPNRAVRCSVRTARKHWLPGSQHCHDSRGTRWRTEVKS